MPILAETALAVLRDHQAELHAAGIRHLALFGSVARAALERLSREAAPD